MLDVSFVRLLIVAEIMLEKKNYKVYKITLLKLDAKSLFLFICFNCWGLVILLLKHRFLLSAYFFNSE